MRRKDDEKQKRIKQAVMETILQEGFAGASISKIAKRAGVSPATVYIYYDNKDTMLRDIYLEYSEDTYVYLSQCIESDMSAADLISTLMTSYYHFIEENQEVFSFVEQFAQCPALVCECSGERDMCGLFQAIEKKKEQGEIRDYSDGSIASVLFAPVKAVASENHISEEDRRKQLAEVIELIERALILQ
ncbi:MAG: TetR/AcrR family transcriptional regulator [Eubacterium sp.]|nr:TetR/AcrR family transcriptional regulator [Eubacterium sp.]